MQVIDTEAEMTGLRASCYRLFSAAFCLPGDASPSADDYRGFAACLDEIGSDASGALRTMADAWDSLATEDIRIEYSRLFVGPFALPAPPYGSVYLDQGRRLMGDSTIDVLRRYREVGIVMDPSQQDVPDHIAVELEFMAYLLHLEQVAVEQDDEAGIVDALQRQESFLEGHLCAWVPTFTEGVVADTESVFFRELVGAVNVFLAEELERVRLNRTAQ